MDINRQPKIVVMGAGAVGSIIGGFLSKAGENVTLIGRPKHVQAINSNGLQIDGILGPFTVNVPAQEFLTFEPDLVLLTVKTQDLESTCSQIKEFIGESGVVLMLNGVRGFEIASAVLEREDILPCVVRFNASYLKPGFVTYTIKGSLLISGNTQSGKFTSEEVRSLLSKAVPTTIARDIIGAQWTKLLINSLGNGLEAMTGMSFGECMDYSDLRRIGIMILREGFEILSMKGVKPDSLPGIPIQLFKFIIKSPVPIASVIFKNILRGTASTTSTLQSILRGVPTEIDYLNGEIVVQGRKVDCSTPYNEKVVEIVNNVERSGQFYTPAEITSLFSLGG